MTALPGLYFSDHKGDSGRHRHREPHLVRDRHASTQAYDAERRQRGENNTGNDPDFALRRRSRTPPRYRRQPTRALRARGCASWISLSRRRGSFCIARRSSRRSASGVWGGNRLQSGSAVMMRPKISVVLSPSKARWPVNISKRTHPNAKISVRRSTALPFACSGDIYPAVPITVLVLRL